MLLNLIAFVYIVWTLYALAVSVFDLFQKEEPKDALSITAIAAAPIAIGGFLGYNYSKKNKPFYTALGIYLGQVLAMMIMLSWFAIGMMSYGAGRTFRPLSVVLRFFGENLAIALVKPFKMLLKSLPF